MEPARARASRGDDAKASELHGAGTVGTRTEGYDACLRFWQDLIDDPTISFDIEDVVVRDDRATIRWRLNTPDVSFRGVNLMHVEDGKIVEALGYAKRP